MPRGGLILYKPIGETFMFEPPVSTSMAREVTTVNQGTHKPHRHALEKEMVVVECDDGHRYVFERATDSPQSSYRLARRVKPTGEKSTSKARLPSAVVEALENLGLEWHK